MNQQEFRKRYEFNIKTDNIGGGSFGTVYKAYDTVLDREVAIKVSEVKTVGDKEFSLLEEFKAIENVPPNKFIANYEEVYRFESFPAIYDYGIMQYYSLGNLSHYLKSNEVSIEKRQNISKGILEGIAFLHQHKVVHRDLKPSNILVVDRNEKIIPKITDFGLSKQAEADGKASRFTNSFAGGTLQYSSPEQLKGLPLKLNTDLWSFGAIAYEILTGKTLFEADSQGTASAEWQNAITQKILHADVTPQLATLPTNWQHTIKACLERDLTKRVQNTDALFVLLNGESSPKKEKETPPIPLNDDETIIKDKPTQKPESSGTTPEESQPLGGNTKQNQLIYLISGVIIIAVALFLWNPWESNLEPKDLQTYLGIKEQADSASRVDSLEVAVKHYQEAESFMISLEHKKANERLQADAIRDSINSITNSINLALTENEAWEFAKSSNTLAAYNTFLKDYPKGHHAEEVKNTIKLMSKYLEESNRKISQMEKDIEFMAHSIDFESFKSKVQSNVFSNKTLKSIYQKLKGNNSGLGYAKIGYLFRFGKGTKQDDEQAVKYFKKGAELNNSNAQYYLGFMYYNGFGISKDSSLGCYWWKKSADQENSNGLFYIGNSYKWGLCDEKDLEKAVYFFQKSADLGSHLSQLKLGEAYEQGKGIAKDSKKAFYWYKKSAEQGDEDAQYQLSSCFYNGRGVSKDEDKAMIWAKKSANQGDAMGQWAVGYYYYNVKDYDQAFLWYKKAADQGLNPAMTNLAHMYNNGYGVEKNMEMVKYWYTKLCDKGVTKMCDELGKM
jgi:TPR repeat protein